MTTTIITFIILYLAGSLLLGVLAYRRSNTTSDDYFIANRSLNWIQLGMTLFATWMSTFAFLGSPGFYYKHGVTWYLPHGFLVVGSPLLLWFIGRKIWKMGKENGYITPADLLSDFYGSVVIRYLVAIISLLALIPYSLIQLTGIGKVLESATNGAIPYNAGILFAVVAIGIYIYLGGIRAIVYTDIIQAVLFGGMMLVGAGVALYAAGGGLSSGFAISVDTRPEAFIFNSSEAGFPITLLIIWTFGYILLPHMWQRAYMAKSAKALTRSIVLGSVLALVLIAIPSVIMGTLGIGFLPNPDEVDKFVPLMYSTWLPLMLPFLVLATFAAGMSTIDSQLLSASSVVIRDIVKPLKKGKLTSQQERKLGKIAVMVLVFILVILSLSPGGQGSIVLLASKGTGIALLLLVPLAGPLLWSQASKYGAIASLITGSIIMIYLEWFKIELPMKFGAPMASLLVQIPIFIVGSLIYPSKEKS